MTTNPAMTTAWLSAIYTGASGAIERRTLTDGIARKRWHNIGDFESIAHKATGANTVDGCNVYFGPHLRSAHGRSGNASVIGTNCVFVEFDGPDHANGGHLAATTPAGMIDEATKRAADACFPEPSIVVASGGGVHLYWLFEAFITDLDAIDRLLYAIVETLRGDFSCTNRERIMRAAGTWNHTRGRMAELIVCDPSRRYTFDDLMCVADRGEPVDVTAPEPAKLDAAINLHSVKRSNSGMSVINTFCDRVDVRDLARRYGGSFVGDKYRRPGKEDRGFSGIVRKNKVGHDVLCTWSENDPCNDRKFGSKIPNRKGDMAIHDSFSLFTLMEHEGDVKAATIAAAKLLGIKLPPQKLDAQVMYEIAESEHAEAFDALLFGTYASDADYLAAQGKAACIVSKFTTNPKQVGRIIALLVSPETAAV